MMDERHFDRIAADTLKALEKALTDVDDRLEVDLASDILALEFDDGKKYIVNSHRAARQIWVSANLQAWHFSPDETGAKWVDTREGHELWALLGELVSKKLGRTIAIARK
jgi:CyaY protein